MKEFSLENVLSELADIHFEGYCVNCGKPSATLVCSNCDKAGRVLANKLKDGITIEYADGSKEVIKDGGE